MRIAGHAAKRVEVKVGERCYTLFMPADEEALLECPRVAERFAADEYMPYWATLWPAALVLADAVAAWDEGAVAGHEVLELGSGLGLVGLVAAGRGARVTVSDYDADALAFVRASARASGLPEPQTRIVDWRNRYPGLRPARILAADVLYERRNLEPIAAFVAEHLAPGGEAWISDAHRSTADGFADVARRAGLAARVVNGDRDEKLAGVPVRGRVFVLSRSQEKPE